LKNSGEDADYLVKNEHFIYWPVCRWHYSFSIWFC